MAIQRIEQSVAHLGNDEVYGPGVDGTVIVNNTATPTVLIRDMYYENLTINSGCTLITNGFRVFVKNTLINNGVIGSTADYTTQISTATVSGQGTGTNTYSVSQASSNPIALSILNDVQKAISGIYVDSSSSLRVLTGGDKGADGANGTGATSGGSGATGTPGNAGATGSPGGDGADGTAGTGGHSGSGANPGGAGGAATQPGHWHYAHAGSGVYYHFNFTHFGLHSMHHGNSGNPGNPGGNGTGHGGTAGTKGNPGNAGGAGNPGNPGASGNPGNPGANGIGGTGGRGGPLVVIAAKTISGSGTIVNVGQNGAAGNAGTAGNPGATGTPGTDGATGTPGNAGTGANPGGAGVANAGHAGTAGNAGDVGVAGIDAYDAGYANHGHTYPIHNAGFTHQHNDHMRTYGGTAGRPANESNNAHFPHRATRFINHAFHWAPPAATRTWPRGSVPANIGHFTIQIGNPFTHFTHGQYVNHNAPHWTYHHVNTPGGAAGAAGGAGNSGVAGNSGNPGTNGAGGPGGAKGIGGAGGASGSAGLAGNAGAAGSNGKDGGIIVVTDSWGLSQTLSSSTKIVLNN